MIKSNFTLDNVYIMYLKFVIIEIPVGLTGHRISFLTVGLDTQLLLYAASFLHLVFSVSPLEQPLSAQLSFVLSELLLPTFTKSFLYDV